MIDKGICRGPVWGGGGGMWNFESLALEDLHWRPEVHFLRQEQPFTLVQVLFVLSEEHIHRQL